jgi:glutaredoxin
VDHIPCLQAWAESLGGINFPLVSDFWPHGVVAQQYGVFRSEGKSERAIFIIDPDGFIRYIDIHDIDDQPDNEILFEELKKIVPSTTQKKTTQFVEPKKVPDIPSEGVVLFCNSWCPDCKRARAWFKINEIDYVEVDVMENREAGRMVREWANGNLVTPTFNINGTVIVNFNVSELEKTLGIQSK